jgi:hypothetical protein
LATSYTLQWSTDQNFVNNVQSKSFPAHGGNQWAVNGLTNGQQFYFRYQGVLGATTSLWSTVVGPVTVGAPTGPVTVTGHATFANAATGPLYVSFTNLTTNKTYYAEVASPVSPQAYSIQLPAGNYSNYAYIDQNHDDILYDNGDMMPTATHDIAISGSSATYDFKLNGGGTSYLTGNLNSTQSVNNIGNSMQYYNLMGVAWSGSKELTAMELLSGPNVIVPQDFYRCQWGPMFSFCSGFNLDGNPPNIGDAYDYKLTYSDGSSEIKTITVGSVPGLFGANPTPSGFGSDLTPNISWTDPANASDYTYTFSFSGGSPRESWEIPASGYGLSFSSSIDSITWGIDPTGGGNLPTQASLTSGGNQNYSWGVTATDSSKNTSSLGVFYYPGYTGLALPAADPATLGAATVGRGYTGTIVALNGTATYTFTVIGLSDGLTSSSSGNTLTVSGTPLAAGTISFQVIVSDSNGRMWGPVTYSINVGN